MSSRPARRSSRRPAPPTSAASPDPLAPPATVVPTDPVTRVAESPADELALLLRSSGHRGAPLADATPAGTPPASPLASPPATDTGSLSIATLEAYAGALEPAVAIAALVATRVPERCCHPNGPRAAAELDHFPTRGAILLGTPVRRGGDDGARGAIGGHAIVVWQDGALGLLAFDGHWVRAGKDEETVDEWVAVARAATMGEIAERWSLADVERAVHALLARAQAMGRRSGTPAAGTVAWSASTPAERAAGLA